MRARVYCENDLLDSNEEGNYEICIKENKYVLLKKVHEKISQ